MTETGWNRTCRSACNTPPCLRGASEVTDRDAHDSLSHPYGRRRMSTPPTGARSLRVEDNADLAFGLRRTLESEGYAVSVAADGPSGIRAALETRPRPDLVILDVMLPGVDGFGVLRALRERHYAAPVLLLTARG